MSSQVDVKTNKRIGAMNDTTIGFDQTEEDILICELSDDALETAAGTINGIVGNWTLAACTGMSVCVD